MEEKDGKGRGQKLFSFRLGGGVTKPKKNQGKEQTLAWEDGKGSEQRHNNMKEGEGMWGEKRKIQGVTRIQKPLW